MGDKDTNALLGNPMLFIGKSEADMKPLGRIVDTPLVLPDYDPREDEIKAFQDSIKIEIPAPALPFFVGIDLASEPSKQVCTIVIEGKPTINKPRNLKYPNKKRARRIWKKWAKRFGTTPGKCLYLPNVEIDCKIATEHNGYLRWDMNANPINQE